MGVGEFLKGWSQGRRDQQQADEARAERQAYLDGWLAGWQGHQPKDGDDAQADPPA